MATALTPATVSAAATTVANHPLTNPENATILNEILALLHGVVMPVRSTPFKAQTASAQASYSPDMSYPQEGHIFVPRSTSPSKKPLNGLIDNINLWARNHGYTVCTTHSLNNAGKRRRIIVACSRAGVVRYRIPEATEELIQEMKEAGRHKPYKKRGTVKCNCPFTFSLVETTPGNLQFEVRYREKGTPAHNHEPMESWTALEKARILPPALQETADKALLRGMSATEVLKELRVEGVDYLLKHDIHNRRRDLYRSALGGQSATNYLLRDLNSRGVPAFPDIQGHQLRQLFVSFKPALDLRGRQLDFIIFDSTFRTNCYNMPMAHFVAMTANRRPYTLAVAFLNGQSENNYDWCLCRLQTLGIHSPVWIVDAELAESNVIRQTGVHALLDSIACVQAS